MERFLVAIDCMGGRCKVVDYLIRVLKETRCCEFVFFHILPTISPDKLRKEEVLRIEAIHAQRPDLAGYFWKEEDEKDMYRAFALARETLVKSGFSDEHISSRFCVESGDIADIIIAKAAEFGCTTIILGRKRLSRVKEFLLGSVAVAVLKMARGAAVWVVED